MVGTGSKLYTLLWRCAEHMLLSSLCLIIDGINGASSDVLPTLTDLLQTFEDRVDRGTSGIHYI